MSKKLAFDTNQPYLAAEHRTEQEESRLRQLTDGGGVGFCIGGYVQDNRTPAACTCLFQPLAPKPTAQNLSLGFNFWGAPNMIKRLIFGWDDQLRTDILSSEKWNGTSQDLDAILASQTLAHPSTIPIRDAIDFVNTCVFSTIKAMKFSSLSQVCGGPIEIAVITADRPFRWVRHKERDSAIVEGAS